MYPVYEAHRWIIPQLGRDLIGIAQSANGYEIIKHKSRQIYGLQFHPEKYTKKSSGKYIFNQIVDVIKNSTL